MNRLILIMCLLFTWVGVRNVTAAELVVLELVRNGCEFCKQESPIVTELQQAGYDIQTINVSEGKQSLVASPTKLKTLTGQEWAKWAGQLGVDKVPSFIVVDTEGWLPKTIKQEFAPKESLVRFFSLSGVTPTLKPTK